MSKYLELNIVDIGIWINKYLDHIKFEIHWIYGGTYQKISSE